ncbi:bacteriocin-like protein [Chryseobacterium contaminans]|uniref:bacteriocin-like protein n=1 Tax=Chryseobacterium contaminans TaxID=1423959 RepID=UPI00301AED11
MKNLKKLNRRELGGVNGAIGSNCSRCPQHTTYGTGPNDAPCSAYQALPSYCRGCVIVSMECVDGGVS